MSFRVFVLALLFSMPALALDAQDEVDSLQLKPEKESSVISVMFKGKPGRALAYSLMLPGAGQVYNGRIWKVPILYAGFGALGYAVHFNSKEFRRFDEAYRMRVDDGDLSKDEFQGILSLSGINSYRQFYDKNLQLSYIGIGLLYLLNGVEAFVDRHLQEFDISKNLGVIIRPDAAYASFTPELSWRITF